MFWLSRMAVEVWSGFRVSEGRKKWWEGACGQRDWQSCSRRPIREVSEQGAVIFPTQSVKSGAGGALPEQQQIVALDRKTPGSQTFERARAAGDVVQAVAAFAEKVVVVTEAR